ncbi:hypothetical protein GDO78_008516 [Eleutherodactylus coqui]|uniref:LEM-like domain-containing protein n=1 Tax=Eleutherodactylus coqui TaxID=57060 RepID=A0A8J6FF56_ELECQ|nr:hypothetical protein GDO78_008516 [Eleutherodactylus coqui]
MPTLTGNPSQYSKDQLKNVLISHNVRLPQGDQRKAVYLQLYLKHILPKDREAADFSSDDEDTSENDLQPVGDHEEKKSDKMDLKSLSDSELKEQLRKHGVNPGPILRMHIILSWYDDNCPGDFSDLMPQSSLGLSATRRKPIKGAAGRPIQFRYDDITTRARMQEQTKETVTEGMPRLVSVRLQILIFIVVVFVALVYFAMESSSENPFNSEDLAEVQQP